MSGKAAGWHLFLGLMAALAAAFGAPVEKNPDGDPVGAATVSGHLWTSPDGTPLPFQSDDEILSFLATAQPMSSKRIGEGLNGTLRVVLEKDGVRMHAAFRHFEGRRYLVDPEDGRQIPVRDSYGYEVAAYRLSRMLGLQLVPPTVLREIDGKPGSLQAWVENAMMEKERRSKGLQPPDEWLWMSWMLTMHLFDNLIGNTDRHQGNLLIDPTWQVWLIDHTQAFRPIDRLFGGDKVLYCDAQVWERLKALDRKAFENEFNGLVGKSEIKAMAKRRDLLVRQIQRLIDEKGAGKVLFSLDS